MNIKAKAGFFQPVRVEDESAQPVSCQIVSIRVTWRDLWRFAWQLFCMGVVFFGALFLIAVFFRLLFATAFRHAP